MRLNLPSVNSNGSQPRTLVGSPVRCVPRIVAVGPRGRVGPVAVVAELDVRDPVKTRLDAGPDLLLADEALPARVSSTAIVSP